MRIRFGKTTVARGRPTSVGGRIGTSLFFLVFGLVGLLFVGLGVRETARAAAMRAWPTIECEMLDCQVEQAREGYRLAVRYRYQVDGQWREANVFRRGGARVKQDYADVQSLAARYAPGERVAGFINPRDPAEVVLERSSAAIGFMIPFAMIFVAVGFGGIWFTWRKPADTTTPLSSTRRSVNPKKIGLVVCAVLLVAGAVATYFVTIRGGVRVFESRHWTPTPCVVISSRVQSHQSDDGTTYSVDILYEYSVARQTYRANRHNLMGGSSSGRAGKEDIVRQYPPGREAVCYVNPANPADATLQRGFRPIMLVGLLPVVFLLIGVVGVVSFLRQGTPAVAKPVGGPVVLRSAASPVLKAAGMLGAALFWNGIVSVFLLEAVRSWQRGRADIFLTIFLIPFVLVGLGLIGGVIYFALAAVNPRPRLTVSAATVSVGGSLQLQWQWTGRVSALERVVIFLEGREEATYQRGTQTTTDKEVFTTVPIAETTRFGEIGAGRATLMVPPDTLPTFKAEHNKIAWYLRLKGAIPYWPDVKEEYEITVTPA